MTEGYKFNSRADLDSAVDAWLDDETAATAIYGDIYTWDVSNGTDFIYMFTKMQVINLDKTLIISLKVPFAFNFDMKKNCKLFFIRKDFILHLPNFL